jgi:hypothetical protein
MPLASRKIPNPARMIAPTIFSISLRYIAPPLIEPEAREFVRARSTGRVGGVPKKSLRCSPVCLLVARGHATVAAPASRALLLRLGACTRAEFAGDL